MKLISITDFVLEQMKIYNSTPFTNIPNPCHVFIDRVEAYAKFLKQPLTLGMFVPCDEEGNVLEEPKGTDLNDSFFAMQVDYNLEIKYQQAKETCIFNNNLLSLIVITELISQNKTVEFLINYYYEKTGNYLETNKQLF